MIKNCKNSIFLDMQVFTVFGTISANFAKKALFCLVSEAGNNSSHNIPPPPYDSLLSYSDNSLENNSPKKSLKNNEIHLFLCVIDRNEPKAQLTPLCRPVIFRANGSICLLYIPASQETPGQRAIKHGRSKF